MAANEYYADTGNQNKDRLDTSPYSSSPTTDANKPLPAPGLYQGSFVPSHGIYNDEPSYASNHYSAQSIDNSYHQQSGKPNDDSTNTLPLNDSFSDNIPLTDRPQHGNAVPMPGGYDYDPERRGGKRPAGSFWVARPWFVYCMTAVHVAVFCFELAQNSKLTGSVIATKPQFNPMIGPSTDVLISIGARFAPCMRKVASFNNTDPTMLYPCPGRTDTILNCTLGEWCGFNGGNIPQEMGGTGPIGSLPNQWYRFIVPIFYHAGIVHLVLNMAMQILLGGMMEVEIGMVRFMIVYFCSGIFGFVLGGNLGAYGQPSV